MRLAAIDIGTNSVHMIVVRVRPDLSFEVIDREKEMVRLGAGGLDGRALTPEAMQAALQVLSKFRRLAESHGVDEIVAVATSAVREAENGGDSCAAIRRTDRHPRARHLGHRRSPPHPPGGRLRRRRRRRDGGRRRHRRRQRRDHARRRPGDRARAQLQARRHPPDRALRQERSARRRATSASSSATSTPRCGEYLDQHRRRPASIASSARRAPSSASAPSRRRDRTADRTRRSATGASRPSSFAACAQAADRRRASRSGCAFPGSIRGAPTSPSPAPSCSTRSCKRLGADGDHAVRSVAARRAGARLHRAAPQGDRAGRSLSRRPPPQRHRAGRALQLLARARAAGRAAASRSSTRRAAIHGLTDREREWLEYAALLHDIGVHISYEGHHKHSYYLIRNGDLRGFEPDEIETIALIARYHRRATPKRRHDGFGDLPRKQRRPFARSRPSCGWPKASTAATRRPSPASSCTTAATTSCCSCGHRATRSSSCGPPPGTPRPSSG